MMTQRFSIRDLDRPIKLFLGSFLFMLSMGYFTGLAFVFQTEAATPHGVVENYNGNEDQPDPQVLKFKKSSREMLTIIHTHVLSLSMIFVITGTLLWATELRLFWKKLLSLEPFASVLITFAGIYGLWMGQYWLAIVVVLSGFLMTTSYLLAVFFIYRDMLKSPRNS
jgi:hypothetical protein